MGTRSLTVVEDDKGKEIVVMYCQMDGYVHGGHGEALIRFLMNRRVINGYNSDDRKQERQPFNGMGCLAAALIAHFKEGIGDTYLYPAGTRDCGEEFIYTIRAAESTREEKPGTWPGKEYLPILLKIESLGEGKVLFDGPVDDFMLNSVEEVIGEGQS